jgi:acyl-CoA oxidase
MRIIGCYAQTELGHGSNIVSLETTATLDKNTDEWVIHTPHISATKFWPGSMGVMSNHAIVFARCIANGKDHGVKPFFVQIRDFDNHMPLEGVKVGDIGPKLGYNSVDNGYLSFDSFRIPRTSMLSKF